MVGRARERVGGLADVAFPGEEHEGVRVDWDAPKGGERFAREVGGFAVGRRGVFDGDWEEPALDCDDGGVPEELGETPEYKTANRSAKKTRRDNRNKNAHRRKPNKNKEVRDEKREYKNNGNHNPEKSETKPNNSHKGEPREAKNNNNRNGNPNKSRNNRRRPSRNDKPQATQESLRAKRHNNPKQTQPMKENKVENKKGIKNLLQKPLKWLRSKF